MSKSITKKSRIQGTGMFALPSKKEKSKRPDRKAKHKKSLLRFSL